MPFHYPPGLLASMTSGAGMHNALLGMNPVAATSSLGVMSSGQSPAATLSSMAQAAAAAAASASASPAMAMPMVIDATPAALLAARGVATSSVESTNGGSESPPTATAALQHHNGSTAAPTTTNGDMPATSATPPDHTLAVTPADSASTPTGLSGEKP
jgi:hypothetical protein